MRLSESFDALLGDPILLASLAMQAVVLPIVALALSRAWRARPERAHAVLAATVATMLVALPATVIAARSGIGAFAATPVEVTATSVASIDDVAASAPARPGPIEIVLGVALAAIALAWAAWTLALLARVVFGVVAARRLVARATPCRPEVGRVVAAALDGPDRLRVVASDELAVPVACGWSGPPSIVLPESARDLGARELRAILLHERAHLRRADHVTTLAADLLVALLPWHPLVRSMRRAMATMAEHCCDADVLASGLDATDYARTLFTVARGEPARPALAALGASTVLADRIGRLLDAPRPRRVRRGLAARAAIIGCAFLAGGVLGVTQTGRAPVALPAGVDATMLAASPVHFVASTIDFGTVEPGSDSTATLELVNLGDRTVRALDVKAGCGCTTIEAFAARDLAPGERMRVPFTIRAPEANGREHVRGVTVAFDGQDPIEATLRLVTSGAPPEDVAIAPPSGAWISAPAS